MKANENNCNVLSPTKENLLADKGTAQIQNNSSEIFLVIKLIPN